MVVGRMTTRGEDMARIAFASKAAEHFAAHPNHWTYSDGDITPGCLLALRWGLGKDCVLVLKLDENEMPVNFQHLIREFTTDA
jgi:hypothetical protein